MSGLERATAVGGESFATVPSRSTRDLQTLGRVEEQLGPAAQFQRGTLVSHEACRLLSPGRSAEESNGCAATAGLLPAEQRDGGEGETGAFSRRSLGDAGEGHPVTGLRVLLRAAGTGANPSPSGQHRRGVAVSDHVSVGGGVWAAAGGRGAALVLNLQPGFAQRLGKVVVHRAGDGQRVGGHWLRLLVVLPKAAAEMLLDHRVAGCVRWNNATEKKKKGVFFFPPQRMKHLRLLQNKSANETATICCPVSCVRVRALTVHPPVAVAQVGAAVVRDWTVRQVAVAVVGGRARDH